MNIVRLHRMIFCFSTLFGVCRVLIFRAGLRALKPGMTITTAWDIRLVLILLFCG